MLSANTAWRHTTTTGRSSRIAMPTGRAVTGKITVLAAAAPIILASSLALATPARAAATWMAGAVNSGSTGKTEAFFYSNAYTESEAEQHALANCRAKFSSGCQLAGSTTSCMAVALGAGSEYAVAYGPTVRAAKVLAAMQIHGRTNVAGGGACSWD